VAARLRFPALCSGYAKVLQNLVRGFDASYESFSLVSFRPEASEQSLVLRTAIRVEKRCSVLRVISQTRWRVLVRLKIFLQAAYRSSSQHSRDSRRGGEEEIKAKHRRQAVLIQSV
jgi:hypothetical protein